MKNVLRIAAREFGAFFASPVAFIFFGTFLAVTLFIFFWVETFFARNIADVRPLFDWMPILLIFLTGAITMRSWSEERRAGTLEFLLTSPTPPWALVVGKFLACLGLVAVALALTLPLPVTVAFLGPLDWGPVFGGYLATFFLAAAYISIGLFISVRSENQIVSLIASVLACSVLYLLGSDTLTSFFGNRVTEILHLLGSGSRFDSITRGVIDLRDLAYYLSLVGVFLSLNIYGLERLRWQDNPANSRHRAWLAVTSLLVVNFLAVNFWLAPVDTVRIDLTRGRIYTISDATRNYLARLREPLLIRGYFSAQTHPLLAPLVPRLRDLLKEYQVAGHGKVRVEFVDPQENPELEQEAGQKYGIRPVPFETASRYQTAVTNSYFDILVKYGDQFETLGFRDLIEIKARGETGLDVDLRNPEYDITRAIRKVLYAYQGSGDLFANIRGRVKITGYISPESVLPKELVPLRRALDEVADEMKKKSGGRVSLEVVDPDGDGGRVAKEIGSRFGFRPMALGLLDPRTFWFYITMENNGQVVQVPLPEDLSKQGLERDMKAALKRFSRGFLKTIALYTPPSTPPMPQLGMPGSGKRFQWLRKKLAEEHKVVDTDLKKGQVPGETDFLLLVSPENLDEKQLFAVDQFLMQGGTVAIASAPFDVSLQGRLSARKYTSGLEKWLQGYGITIGDTMVLDEQNSPFPVPMERRVGMFTVRETRLVNYPYFIDIRQDGMDRTSGLTSGINQVTMTWASPITVDGEKNGQRKVIRLLASSDRSWTSDSLDIQPDFQRYGELGFEVGDTLKSRLLGVMVEGRFDSAFAGKTSPLVREAGKKAAEKKKAAEAGAEDKDRKEDGTGKEEPVISRVIDRSPGSARIILFASNSFLTDTAMELMSSVLHSQYLAPAQLVANAVDWSLEDRDLLSIRGRGHFARTLMPMDRKSRMFWEYLNYGLALVGLGLIWLFRRLARQRAMARYRQILSTGRA